MERSDLEYVGFWLRVGAALIDTLLLGVVCWPLVTAIYGPRILERLGFHQRPRRLACLVGISSRSRHRLLDLSAGHTGQDGNFGSHRRRGNWKYSQLRANDRALLRILRFNFSHVHRLNLGLHSIAASRGGTTSWQALSSCGLGYEARSRSCLMAYLGVRPQDIRHAAVVVSMIGEGFIPAIAERRSHAAGSTAVGDRCCSRRVPPGGGLGRHRVPLRCAVTGCISRLVRRDTERRF